MIRMAVVSMVSEPEYVETERIILDSSTYKYVDGGNLAADLRCLRTTASDLAAHLAGKMKDPSLEHYLLKPLRRGDSLIATLQMTIKSHKDVGDQVPRALHTSPCFGREGFARYLTEFMKDILKPMAHLMRDSQHARR